MSERHGNNPPGDFIASSIESGILPLEEIVTHTFPLSQYEEGLKLLRAGKALKVVIYPEEY